jgi:peroxiredoxin
MIKHFLLLGFLMSSVFVPAQKKKQPKPFSFTVSGTISKFNGSMIYLHHKWDEVDHTDSAAVVNGAFSFNLKSVDPNMYWFTLSRKVTEMPNVIFFADKTPTIAKLIGDSLLYSTVTGGQTQKDYMDYKGVMNKLTLTQQQLQSEYTLANQKSDQAAVKVIQGKYQTVTAEYYSVELKNFVKSHPKSAVSGYIIYREFNNPNVPIDLAFECLSYVDKSIENTKFIKLATKRVTDIKGTMMGATATNFSQNTADGKSIQLKDYRGKYVLIDFWASWCRPCRMENPMVVAAYEKYKDKGFDVLGVSLDTNKEQWTMAIKNDKLTWTNVSDLKGGGNEVAVLFGIQNIPQNVLIDKEGKIVAKNLRGPALEEKLAELIK